MKYFQHQCDASEDEFLVELQDRFGLEGYARWWKLCEIVGKYWKVDRRRVRLSWNILGSFLAGKRNKLISFLEHCRNEKRIIFSETGNILEIEIPNLFKYRDEYARKSGDDQYAPPDKVAERPFARSSDEEVLDSSLGNKTKEKEENLKPSSSKRPKRPKFESDSEPIRLARLFFTEHVALMDSGTREPDYQTWARHFDLMIRHDDRMPDHIATVIAWVHNDGPKGQAGWNGWASVILSPKKLREKFTTIVARMSNGSSVLPFAPGTPVPRKQISMCGTANKDEDYEPRPG